MEPRPGPSARTSRSQWGTSKCKGTLRTWVINQGMRTSSLLTLKRSSGSETRKSILSGSYLTGRPQRLNRKNELEFMSYLLRYNVFRVSSTWNRQARSWPLHCSKFIQESLDTNVRSFTHSYFSMESIARWLRLNEVWALYVSRNECQYALAEEHSPQDGSKSLAFWPFYF